MNQDRTLPWDWFPGKIPANVAVDDTAHIETTYSFELFRSRQDQAIQIGRGSSIYLGVMFDMGPDARIRIGNFTGINGARIICDSEMTIGDYCLISWNILLMDSYRAPVSPAERREYLQRLARGGAYERRRASVGHSRAPGPIRIGSNVWVGFECCILPGVRIGDGSIIGARSVVTADVPDYSIAVGNPARVIRRLDPVDPSVLRRISSSDQRSLV